MLGGAHTAVGLKKNSFSSLFFFSWRRLVCQWVDRAEEFLHGEGKNASNVVQVAGSWEQGVPSRQISFLCDKVYIMKTPSTYTLSLCNIHDLRSLRTEQGCKSSRVLPLCPHTQTHSQSSIHKHNACDPDLFYSTTECRLISSKSHSQLKFWKCTFKKHMAEHKCIKVINIYGAGKMHIRQARCHLAK